MRRKIGFFSIVMAFGSASFSQSPPSDVTDKLATFSFEDALVAALQEEMSISADPAVQDFIKFSTIPADKLLTQDAGYIFSQPTMTAQPQAAVKVPAAAQVVQPTPGLAPAAKFQQKAAVQAQAVRHEAANVYAPKDLAVAAEPTAVAQQIETRSVSDRVSKFVRPHYSDRRQYVPTKTLPPNAEQNLTDWYHSQLPSQLWPGSAGAPSQYQVLFLSECLAEDLPGALEDAIGGELLPANDRPAIDRARVELALAHAGLDLPLPVFSLRVSGNQRSGTDPAIAELNAMLWTAYQSSELKVPTVVLEKYCGRRLPVAYAMSYNPTNHYRVTIPQNLTATHAAPFFYAEVCRRKTGSRYYDASCKRWEPIQSGKVIPGIGRYRLVGMRGDATISYLYQVEGSKTPSAENPQTVEPTLEP